MLIDISIIILKSIEKEKYLLHIAMERIRKKKGIKRGHYFQAGYHHVNSGFWANWPTVRMALSTRFHHLKESFSYTEVTEEYMTENTLVKDT